MDIAKFEKIVNASIDKIPEKFRVVLEKENVKLLARERVPKILQNKFRNKLIFGVFVGVPHTKRSVFNVHQEPTRIELYKESFEKAFTNMQDIETQIIKTVVHEIGHYFGFSESKIRSIGY